MIRCAGSSEADTTSGQGRARRVCSKPSGATEVATSTSVRGSRSRLRAEQCRRQRDRRSGGRCNGSHRRAPTIQSASQLPQEVVRIDPDTGTETDCCATAQRRLPEVRTIQRRTCRGISGVLQTAPCIFLNHHFAKAATSATAPLIRVATAEVDPHTNSSACRRDLLRECSLRKLPYRSGDPLSNLRRPLGALRVAANLSPV